MKTTTEKSFLFEAIRMRLTRSIEKAIREGHDLNELSPDGYTAIIEALEKKLDESALLLIEAGADVTWTDSRGANALYFAALNGSYAVFKRLVEMGESIDVKVDGYPILNAAASAAPKYHRINVKVTRMVNGKEVLVTDQAEIEKAIGRDRYKDFQKIIDHLLNMGADVNMVERENGQSSIALLASRGGTQIMESLIHRGGDVNQTDKYGLTPLHWAARAGREENVALLLQHGANPNAAEAYGFTPLHEAAENNRVAIVKQLLAVGADKSLGTLKAFSPYPKGATARDVAAKRNWTQVVEILS